MLVQAETQPYNSRTEPLVKLWSDPGQTWYDQKGALEGWVSGTADSEMKAVHRKESS